MPLFSVVTVCFNAETTIAGTAASLRAQRFKDYEWLVVDGASYDGTLLEVQAAGIPQMRLLSEPDNGIYDAMNKAVGLARGEWLYFLNAGDALADPDVLEDIAQAAKNPKGPKLIFGDMLYVNNSEEHVRRFAHVRPSSLMYDDLNHQAVFAKRDLFDSFGRFDSRYKMSADYDWLLRVFVGGTPVAYLPRIVARFALGGLHARNLGALLIERRQLRLTYVKPVRLWFGYQLSRLRRRLRILRGHGG